MNLLTVNLSVLGFFFETPSHSVTFIDFDLLYVSVIILMYMNWYPPSVRE